MVAKMKQNNSLLSMWRCPHVKIDVVLTVAGNISHEQHEASHYAHSSYRMHATGAACLEIALALVDAHHLVLIDLLPRLDKQPPALLHALNGVRSHLP